MAIPNWKCRNALLILASLVFYAWGEPVYILLLLFSVLVNWLLALALARRETGRKALIAAAVILNIGLLVVFKYSGFLVQSVNDLLHLALPVPNIRLPIGISFFTFQTLSYVIDVYRDKNSVQTKLPRLLLYISFFPQLIAGPIVKYHDIQDQLETRPLSSDRMAEGLKRFLYGLAKKVLLANAMADNTDTLLSGFEELLAVLREILEAIYGIELTDDDIGHAVQRWQRKQAIATGGFY